MTLNDINDQIDSIDISDLTKLRVVLKVHGMDEVRVRKDVTYAVRGDDALCLDVYTSPNSAGPMPAVVFVAGYADSAATAMAGIRLKDWGSYVSWGELAAASGFVGITYSTAAPPEDAKAALRFIRDHAAELNVDPDRIGIWAISGNGPAALSLLASEDTKLRFAVMLNTYMLDSDDNSTVSDMAATIGFSAPNDGITISDLDPETPMFLVRSGRDEVPGLNATFDRFVVGAIAANRSITVVNLPEAPHGFDTLHETDESRDVLKQVLAFMASSVANQKNTGQGTAT